MFWGCKNEKHSPCPQGKETCAQRISYHTCWFWCVSLLQSEWSTLGTQKREECLGWRVGLDTVVQARNGLPWKTCASCSARQSQGWHFLFASRSGHVFALAHDMWDMARMELLRSECGYKKVLGTVKWFNVRNRVSSTRMTPRKMYLCVRLYTIKKNNPRK